MKLWVEVRLSDIGTKRNSVSGKGSRDVCVSIGMHGQSRNLLFLYSVQAEEFITRLIESSSSLQLRLRSLPTNSHFCHQFGKHIMYF